LAKVVLANPDNFTFQGRFGKLLGIVSMVQVLFAMLCGNFEPMRSTGTKLWSVFTGESAVGAIRIPFDQAMWIFAIVLVGQDDIFISINRPAVAVDKGSAWRSPQQLWHVLVSKLSRTTDDGSVRKRFHSSVADWRAPPSGLVELEAAGRVAERIVRPKAAELVFDVRAYVTTLGAVPKR